MISDHENRALDHSRILEFHKFFSEYHIWFEVGSERFRVTLRIYETNDGRYYFVQSHFVRTPNHDGQAHATHLTHPSPHSALTTAVESITTFYDDAVKEGHEPSLDWFVPNELF